jgi:hypothetical protein
LLYSSSSSGGFWHCVVFLLSLHTFSTACCLRKHLAKGNPDVGSNKIYTVVVLLHSNRTPTCACGIPIMTEQQLYMQHRFQAM